MRADFLCLHSSPNAVGDNTWASFFVEIGELLEKSVGEKSCREVLEKSLVEESWGEVLEKSVVEKCWRRVLETSVVQTCLSSQHTQKMPTIPTNEQVSQYNV